MLAPCPLCLKSKALSVVSLGFGLLSVERARGAHLFVEGGLVAGESLVFARLQVREALRGAGAGRRQRVSTGESTSDSDTD
jgi:hypothetical protein